MILLNITIALITTLIIVFLCYKIHRNKNDYEDYISQLEEQLSIEQDEAKQLRLKISSTRCFLCNAPSNGKHFCYTCYSKYKSKAIDIRIKNCATVDILDPYGNKVHPCTDGTLVRSRAEAMIGSHLFNHKIRYIYEKPIYYSENGKTGTLHPDFYLPDFDVYIEYNEFDTEDYLQKKRYAMRIYAQKKMNVIVMTAKDLGNIAAFLATKLNVS